MVLFLQLEKNEERTYVYEVHTFFHFDLVIALKLLVPTAPRMVKAFFFTENKYYP